MKAWGQQGRAGARAAQDGGQSILQSEIYETGWKSIWVDEPQAGLCQEVPIPMETELKSER